MKRTTGQGLTTILIFAAVTCLVIGGTFWAGIQYERGRAAQRAVAGAQDDVATLRDLARETQARAAAAVDDFRAAAADLHETAERYEQDRAHSQQTYARIGAAMAGALAARPDLAGVDVGPAGLQAWNAANRGSAGVHPDDAAADRGIDPAAVSADAAGAERPTADADVESRRGRGAARSLPTGERSADRGGREARASRAAGDRPVPGGSP